MVRGIERFAFTGGSVLWRWQEQDNQFDLGSVNGSNLSGYSLVAAIEVSLVEYGDLTPDLVFGGVGS